MVVYIILLYGPCTLSPTEPLKEPSKEPLKEHMLIYMEPLKAPASTLRIAEALNYVFFL